MPIRTLAYAHKDQAIGIVLSGTGKPARSMMTCNLIASTNIATIFVDRGVRIKRFTSRATDLLRITLSDIGRSLRGITNRLEYEELANDLGRTLDTFAAVERKVTRTEGKCYIPQHPALAITGVERTCDVELAYEAGFPDTSASRYRWTRWSKPSSSCAINKPGKEEI